ncbi:MAG: glutamine amidotransferase [Deltaproteobacteria bacterium]|jgi:GMP synthase (glutamine-hydrolysing)|nr:glutamine amidotransferase [Deltaproteobacteria bacterium]
MAGEKKLLILAAGRIPARYGLKEDFPRQFLRLGGIDPAKCLIVDAPRRPLPGDLSPFLGAIVTGSLSMVTDRPLWSLKLGDFLLRLLDAGLPLLGVCYGHQLLASALGGRVDYNPQGIELGTFTVALKPGARRISLLRGLPPSFPANLCHAQSVVEAPAGAKVLGESSLDPCQILSYGNHVLTVQFHPEFDYWTTKAFVERAAYGKKRRFRDVYLGVPLADTPESASVLENFAARLGVRKRGGNFSAP